MSTLYKFDSKVAGIPCSVHVHHYTPGDPGNTSGPPDAWYPPEGAELDFTLHSLRDESRLRWLEDKVSANDYDRLGREYEELTTPEEYYDE